MIDNIWRFFSIFFDSLREVTAKLTEKEVIFKIVSVGYFCSFVDLSKGTTIQCYEDIAM